jgi:PBSX family phage terminase large subunit
MKLKSTIVFQKNWAAMHARNEDGSRKYRYLINKGSSRSSKTVSLIDCYDLYARANDSKRLTVWRDTKTDCKKTVLNDALKRLKSTERYLVGQEFNKTESIFTYDTESTFEIHGTDDEETVHGLSQAVAWLNEPYKISKETFDQIDQRTEDFIVIDLNPKKAHWTEDLEKDPRSIVIHSTFRDNPFCPDEQRRKILSYQCISQCALVKEKVLREEEAKAYDLIANPKSFSEKYIKELKRCRRMKKKNQPMHLTGKYMVLD